MSDIPTDTTDPRAWHAYVAGAHTFTEAAERIDAAVRHGVDFQALRRAHREARSSPEPPLDRQAGIHELGLARRAP